jgi:hypothetical protein
MESGGITMAQYSARSAGEHRREPCAPLADLTGRINASVQRAKATVRHSPPQLTAAQTGGQQLTGGNDTMLPLRELGYVTVSVSQADHLGERLTFGATVASNVNHPRGSGMTCRLWRAE